jgi:hypothetical protein
MNHSSKYFIAKHYSAIDNANTYKDLYIVAMDILKHMPHPIIMVCGPVSTGGVGDIHKNIEILNKTIIKLSSQGNHVFSQIPFEDKLQLLKEKFGRSHEEKAQILLDDLYLPIYKSGLIKKFYFIHGWESSHGARWERKIAATCQIEIEDLPKDFLD